MTATTAESANKTSALIDIENKSTYFNISLLVLVPSDGLPNLDDELQDEPRDDSEDDDSEEEPEFL